MLLNFNLYFDKINNIVNVEEVEFKRLNTCIKKSEKPFSNILFAYFITHETSKTQKQLFYDQTFILTVNAVHSIKVVCYMIFVFLFLVQTNFEIKY